MSVIISEIKEAIRYYKRIPDFRKVTRAFERGEESLPISISVQTISACNAECVFCPYPTRIDPFPNLVKEFFSIIIIFIKNMADIFNHFRAYCRDSFY